MEPLFRKISRLYLFLKIFLLKNEKVKLYLSIALIVSTFISGFMTYFILRTPDQIKDKGIYIYFLLNLDLILGSLFLVMVLRRVVKLWISRRKGLAGSALHVRLSFLFALVSILPTILVTFFSMFLFNLGFDSWFNKTISTILNESTSVAQSYLGEHESQIKNDIYALKNSLERAPFNLIGTEKALNNFLSKQVELRGLTEGMIITENFQVIAQSTLTFSMALEKIPDHIWEKVKKGDVGIFFNASSDRVRVLLKLNRIGGGYLYLGRYVSKHAAQRIQLVERAIDDYNHMHDKRSDLQITFALIYIIISLLLVLSSIWIGLSFAGYLAKPIRRLIVAAERIRLGDLTHFVDVDETHKELGTLARAFNRMLNQITLQSQELKEQNSFLDDQNRFIRAVLGGVTAGVLSARTNGSVDLINSSATSILRLNDKVLEDRTLKSIAPFFEKLFLDIKNSENTFLQGEAFFTDEGHTITLSVRVSKNIEHDGWRYIFTFDDISDLISAQRIAAWSDVAKRIAHEIKNPLTPIQLSAERIKKKYSPQIQEDQEIFITCVSTIIHHVGQIRQMVDEFSSLAKMPSSKLSSQDLVPLLKELITLQQMAHPEVEYRLDAPLKLVFPFDRNLFSQALTNILLNAFESFEELDKKQYIISVKIFEQGNRIFLIIEDNGKGLPKENREKLFEPYLTTRQKGTGLGLSIVKKIIEEHKGTILLKDSDEFGGARIEINIMKTGSLK